MIKVLVNDGIHPLGKEMMEQAGYLVNMDKIAQEDLMQELSAYDAICVRSATKVRKELIDVCPKLKVIARGGVGLDNIDVDYARSKGIKVINTPAASSRSVAELAFAHMLSCARFVYDSNRKMPTQGQQEFGKLKKSFAKGCELSGKTLGVIGMGRIGQEAMKIGVGLDMNIIAHDPYVDQVTFTAGSNQFPNDVSISSMSKEMVLKEADFLTLHVPFTGEAVLSTTEFNMMKNGIIITNAARGGVIDEAALLLALGSGKVGAIGLDVFANEPQPMTELLEHPRISLTPHIGASTIEAQIKVGKDLAEQVIEALS